MIYHFTYTFAICSWYSYLALAQQPCYWYDRSEVNGMLNCYSSQDSACCWPSQVCLSNGLCYNPAEDLVRSAYSTSFFVQPFENPRFDSSTEHVRKAYRGSCTVRDWSNTTVCLTQFCPEGKFFYKINFASCFGTVISPYLRLTFTNQFNDS